MQFDFFEDLKNELQRLLKEMGLRVPTNKQLYLQDKRSDDFKNKDKYYDLRNLLIHFFTAYSRMVPVIKWNVYVSDKLKNRNEIIDIQSKLKTGTDINKLLSRNVKKLNQTKYNDLLKYEWGIYHFHFKEDRSNELLFVYLNESSAYLLDILEHEKPDGSIVTWTNTDLIQIIHDNWPNVIKPFIFLENSNSKKLTTEERKALRRRSGSSHIIVTDGTEYIPLGSGISISKHPNEAIEQSDLLFKSVKRLQTVVQNNIPTFKKKLIGYTSEPNLQLILNEKLRPQVVEMKSKIIVIEQHNQNN